MEETDIPDLNIFMVCEKLNPHAFRHLPFGYFARNLEEAELDIWKQMPFDNQEDAIKHHDYMTEYWDKVYTPETFFEKCLVVCDAKDNIIGTCFEWKAYQKASTLHWFKILKEYEGKGLGRALLTEVMKDIPEDEFPVFLHTQPSSFRAIKLYSDFGFKILTNKTVGYRENNIEEALPILKEFIPDEFFSKLEFIEFDEKYLEVFLSSKQAEF